MKVAIVGYGAVEGKSSLAYWQSRGAQISIRDENTDIQVPQGVDSRLGPDYLDGLDDYDVIMRNAAVHPQKILDKNPGVAGKITTLVNEFLRVCPTKNTIGVTGTKGKGTTCTLITKMLQAAGKHVFLAGNIGRSPFDFIDQLNADSWVVLELSSFQLFDITHSPHIAVCLMVVPEHLNWHTGMDDYSAAKSRLFAAQTKDDTAIYFAENQISKQIASQGSGTKIPYYAKPGAYVRDDAIMVDDQTVCQTTELKLLGKHNWQNACAAITAATQALGKPDVDAFRSVLTTFTGLEHHIELVRELDGIKYYDDSFGTTPETAQVAIEALKQPKVLILGGSDKGIPFDGLAKTVASDNVRQVIIIGQTGPKITEALKKQGYDAITPGGQTMTQIVDAAKNAAQPGDIVLLSTGCASFGMFKNYKDRGAQFKEAVNRL